MRDLTPLLQKARYAARRAGLAIMQLYHQSKIAVIKKKDESPLTLADNRAHDIIINCLAESKLPVLSEEGLDIPYDERKHWELFWMIDPLDGTKEFLTGNGEFTVNIALVHHQHPIAGVIYVPVTDILYYGSKETGVYKIDKGVSKKIPSLAQRIDIAEILQKEHVTIAASRSHLSDETKGFFDQFKNFTVISSGSSLKFMLLVEQQADIYPRLGKTMEWDTAAAHALLNACNRGVYQIDLKSELMYNKPDLANPSFIAF